MNEPLPLDAFADFACRLADAARVETLGRWREAGASRDKGGGSYDPVTEADVAAEQAMRAMIREAYPGHGIMGEELPDHPSTSGLSWSLDPIDGTRSFVCGLPNWTTLIALLWEGEPIVGLIDAPRLGERYVGFARAARLMSADGDNALAVSGCRLLDEARLSTTDPHLFGNVQGEAFERVRKTARMVRFGHDGYAYARLAAGTIDLVVEAGLKPYDLLALVPVVRGAGGVIGDWDGGGDLSAGRLVAAATPELFAETVAMLAA